MRDVGQIVRQGMSCNLLMNKEKIGSPRPVYEPRGREFESLRARQNTRPPAMGAFLFCPIRVFFPILLGEECILRLLKLFL